MIMGLAKAANAVFMSTTPKSTHSVGPSSEVTGMGTGSVIHHIATSAIMESRVCSSAVSPLIGVSHTSTAHSGPSMAPAKWRLLSKELWLPSMLLLMFYYKNTAPKLQ